MFLSKYFNKNLQKKNEKMDIMKQKNKLRKSTYNDIGEKYVKMALFFLFGFIVFNAGKGSRFSGSILYCDGFCQSKYSCKSK